MKIINAGYQLINESSITKKIERIARVCYKSEDKIGEGTDLKMITALLQRQHYAMLEHGDVCMAVSSSVYTFIDDIIHLIEETMAEKSEEQISIIDTPEPKKIYLRRTTTYLKDGETHRHLISGNIRAWYEFFLYAAAMRALPWKMYDIVNCQMNHLFDKTEIAGMDIGVDDNWSFDYSDAHYDLIEDVTLLTPEERMVHETFSVLFTVDRGITHELVRMRDCSFAQESTRYCNYSAGKFGNEITVILPCFFEENSEAYKRWLRGCRLAENEYVFMTNELKVPAQQARNVLPTSVKAEIVMTTNLREWKHIFSLRACDSTGPAHPQMKEVMIPLFKEMRASHGFAFGDMLAADESRK